MNFFSRPANAQKWQPPAFRAESAVLLKRLLLVLAVGTLLFIAKLILTDRFVPRNLLPLMMAIVMFLAYRELAAGRIKRGMIVMSWGLWLSICAFSFAVAGLRTPGLYGLPVLLMIAAWAQGPRAVLYMAAATLVVFGALAVADYQGWLPPPVPRTSFDLLQIFGVVTAVAAALVATLAANFQRHFSTEQALAEELRQRIAELNASEAALRELNDALETRVKERTDSYQRANASLLEAMERLERTRDELVQSEKLAALGSMVAGVSHELSSPLGNALLVATTLQHQLGELDASIAGGALTQRQFKEAVDEAGEAARLVSRNVERAIGLVSSFKQTAVDQASQQRRVFDLATVVGDTIASLRPQYKRDPWQMSIDVASDIVLDSYPGPLEQIIVNLVSNSIRHGFDGRTSGCITLSGRLAAADAGGAEHVVITVADDGNGIAAEDLGRVFDPFFTTKLGHGGSGVGLNLVHRIATTILGGSIAVRSEPGQGATFTLRIPRRAPGQL